MSVIAGVNVTLYGTCGVGLIAGFSQPWDNRPDARNIETVVPYGGAGWQVAGFVNTDVCKEAYEILKKRYKIVMQTPTRRNSNSGNRFFCCIYDSKKPKWVGKKKGAPQPVYDISANDKLSWPFKTSPARNLW